MEQNIFVNHRASVTQRRPDEVAGSVNNARVNAKRWPRRISERMIKMTGNQDIGRSEFYQSWLCPLAMLGLAAGILTLLGLSVGTTVIAVILVGCPLAILWAAFHARDDTSRAVRPLTFEIPELRLAQTSWPLLFGWEILQSPFYQDTFTTSWTEILYNRLHCSAADVLILLAAFWLVALFSGRRWMAEQKPRATACFILSGVLYTLFSEYRNVYVTHSWTYSPWMPLLGGIGVAPLTQWIIIPWFVLQVLEPRATTEIEGTSVNVKKLYSDNADKYLSAISFVGYPEALQKFFESYDRLRADLRVLDAGCGAGTATFALIAALDRYTLPYRTIDGFDLTPAMLTRFQNELSRRNIRDVNLREADVLSLETLPSTWTDYDLIISAAMLEYLPRAQLSAALNSLGLRLAPGGHLLIFITRKNPLTKLLIEKWWKANRYTRNEITNALRSAGFNEVVFSRFPFRCFWQNFGAHVVEAKSHSQTQSVDRRNP